MEKHTATKGILIWLKVDVWEKRIYFEGWYFRWSGAACPVAPEDSAPIVFYFHYHCSHSQGPLTLLVMEEMILLDSSHDACYLLGHYNYSLYK